MEVKIRYIWEANISCMESLRELFKGYELKDIWNWMKVDAILKLCQRKVLSESGKKLKVVRGQSKGQL